MAENKLNGKCYVGQTRSTLEKRKKQHLYAARKASIKFHYAIQKYGLDGFNWSILAENVPAHHADVVEVGYQGLYNTVEGGYNCFYRGNNGFNHLPLEEHRRMSSLGGKSHKGKGESQKTRENISRGLRSSEKFRIMKQSPEYRQERSKDSKANWRDPNSIYNTAEYRAKLEKARVARFERDFESIKPKLSALLQSNTKKKDIRKLLGISHPTLQKYIRLLN